MYSDSTPEPQPSFWDQTQFMWIILSVVFVLGIIYTTHRAWQRAQFRRAEQERPHTDRGRSWATAVYQNLGLQIPQQAHVRRGSEVSIAAPQYGRHANDRAVPESVKLEQRGKYQYVAKGEDPPDYEGRSGEEREG